MSRKAVAAERGLDETELACDVAAGKNEHTERAGSGALEDRLAPFQMGNLLFAFRLIDSDADGLIDIDDVQVCCFCPRRRVVYPLLLTGLCVCVAIVLFAATQCDSECSRCTFHR